MENATLTSARHPFCWAAAWLWLVGQARFKDERVELNGKVETVERGQLTFSLRYLANAWRWDVSEVRRALERFCKEKMITLKTDTGQTVITLCNYAQYNDVSAATDTETAHDQHTTSTEYKKERIKEEVRKTVSCPPGGGSGPPESGQEGRSPTQPDLLPTAKIIPMPSSDADRAFEMWNETAKHLGLPTVRVVCEGRRQKMNARLKEIGGISAWREALEKVGQSPFLLGDNDRGWKADITFMLQQSSLAKVLEGAYTGMGTRRQSKPSALDAAEALERRWGIQGSKF